MRRRVRIEITGAVQGVGFRPFVYRLAGELGLAGWVANDARGVLIEAEGPHERLAELESRLRSDVPRAATIAELGSRPLDPTGEKGFRIVASEREGAASVQMLPDLATCPACLAEAADPANRRHRYPFTNCTDCGPRFTIIESLPYDRPRTTMKRFAMCDDCRREYEDPADRRFHAQPNACPECGPSLALWETDGTESATGDAALRGAATALREGRIVAVKGLGGFHLMVDAADGAALARLRGGKPRRDKPFAVMVRDLDEARALCRIDPSAEQLLLSPGAPILLLERRPDAPLHESVAPGNPYLGLMLAYTPLHRLLLDEVGRPLVATSGNLSDEPICIDEREALHRLSGVAELFLVHDRPIARHVDDSVAWLFDERPRMMRRARGWAPAPVRLDRELPPILAVGGQMKNAVALSIGRQVFLSQHIGDMDSAEALGAFERVVADFLELYDVQPVAVAHDLHPDYTATRWARAATRDQTEDRVRGATDLQRLHGLRRIPVQHHHAHLAACLAENSCDGPALGVTWDGTGYGSDGTVWGGEFLLGDCASFRRAAHLLPFRLPGGDAAIREPRRSALALLWEMTGTDALERDDLAPVSSFSRSERKLLAGMLDRGVSAPVTTSAGRLFDGVAALLGLHQRISFEGQAAMALEFVADPAVTDAYPVLLTEDRVSGNAASNGRPAILDWRPTIEAILEEVRRGTDVGVISTRFHNALAEGVLQVARSIGEHRVALSGGCFQNRLLLSRSVALLREAGFELLLHAEAPPNDGGIGLGQIAVAAALLESIGGVVD